MTWKIDFESQILVLFDISPKTQFSKFNYFLWVCWFLGKNLSNFVPPVWKLHNLYCHTLESCTCLLALNLSAFSEVFSAEQKDCDKKDCDPVKTLTWTLVSEHKKNWIDWVIIGVTLVEEFFKSRVKNQKSILEKYVFDMYLISWCLIFYFYGSIFLVFWKLLISVTYCLIIAVSIGYSSMNFKLKTYKFHNIFRSCHHTV